MRVILASCIFTLLFGCQTLFGVGPETFNEKLTIGYSTVTTIRTSTLTLLKAKKISPDDAQNIQNQADNARQGLDIARNLSKTSVPAAEDKLQATTVILQQLQTYLATKGK